MLLIISLLIIFVAVSLLMLQTQAHAIQYTFFLRVPLLFAALLVLFPVVLLNDGLATLLANLFEVEKTNRITNDCDSRCNYCMGHSSLY